MLLLSTADVLAELFIGLGIGTLMMLDISPMSRSSISIISFSDTSPDGAGCAGFTVVSDGGEALGTTGVTSVLDVDFGVVAVLVTAVVCPGRSDPLCPDVRGWIESQSALNLMGTSSLIFW